MRRWLILAVAATLLSGCSARYVRDSAQEQLRAGNYEQAIATLREALKARPGSIELLAGLRSAQEEATNVLLAAANAERSFKRWDRAEVQVKRILSIDPASDRARAALEDIGRERRVESLLRSAKEAVAGGSSYNACNRALQHARTPGRSEGSASDQS